MGVFSILFSGSGLLMELHSGLSGRLRITLLNFCWRAASFPLWTGPGSKREQMLFSSEHSYPASVSALR